jgi:hypothetical protein
MIDPETIEDTDDCDGEALSCYGYDTETGQWCWGLVPLEYIFESGRSDLIARLHPRYQDGDEEAA